MIRIITITCLFILNALSTYGQKPDSVLVRVRYTYTNKEDTLTNGKTRSENMLLFLGKSTSLYTSYDKIRHEIADEQKFWAMVESGAGKGKGVFIVDDTNSKWMTTSSYLFDLKENKLFTKEMFFYQSYIAEEPAPVFDWKLSKDTLRVYRSLADQQNLMVCQVSSLKPMTSTNLLTLSLRVWKMRKLETTFAIAISQKALTQAQLRITQLINQSAATWATLTLRISFACPLAPLKSLKNSWRNLEKPTKKIQKA
jgi:hypothetical protein